MNEVSAEQLVWTSARRTLAGHSGQAPVLRSQGWPEALSGTTLQRLARQHFLPATYGVLDSGGDSWDCVEFTHTEYGPVIAIKRYSGTDPEGRPGAYLSWLLAGDALDGLHGLLLAHDPRTVINWAADSPPVDDASLVQVPVPPPPTAAPSDESVMALLALTLQVWDGDIRVVAAVPGFRSVLDALRTVLSILPPTARQQVTYSTQHSRPEESPAHLIFADPAISAIGVTAGQKLLKAEALANLADDQIGSTYVETAQRLVDLAADGLFSNSVALTTFTELSAWAQTEHDLVHAPDVLDDQAFLDVLASARGALWVNRPPVLSSLVRRLGVPAFVGSWLKRGDAWDFGDGERSMLRHELGVRLRDSILTGAPDPDMVRAHQMVGGDEQEFDTVVLAAIPDDPDMAIAPAMLPLTQDAVTRNAQDASDEQLAAWAQHDALATVLPPQAAVRVMRSWLAGSPLPPKIVRIIADAEVPGFVSEARRHLEAHHDSAAELRRINEIVSHGVGATLTEATQSIVQPPKPALPRFPLPGQLDAHTEPGDAPPPVRQPAGLVTAETFIVAAIALLVGVFVPSATVSVALAVVCGLAGLILWIRSRSPRRPS